MISVKTKPQLQESEQPAPFSNLRLVNTSVVSSGSKDQQTPFQFNFPSNCSRVQPVSCQPPGSLDKGDKGANTSIEDPVGVGEHFGSFC